MSFADFFAHRNELVGQQVVVDGKVVFDIVCPPPQQSPSQCVASAYLTDDTTSDLGTDPSSKGIRLYDHGSPVGCGVATTANLECNGWHEGTKYRVTGTVEHQTAGGQQLQNLILNASNRTVR